MNYELYTAYQGMRARQQSLDVMANNIANASTAGFKADRVLYRSIEAAEIEAQRTQPESRADQPSLPATPAAQASGQTSTAQTSTDQTTDRPSAKLHVRPIGILTDGATDFSPGAIRQTGRSLDVALDGNGFLVVQTPRGERYTRAGSLTLDSSGQLVTQRGDLVVCEGGAITVPPGEVMIGEDGTISVKGQTLGRLKLVSFASPRAALAKEGESLFLATGQERPVEATDTRVVQGALEMSNVNTIGEMVAMMQNGREFESLQRSITLLMNDLGRKVASEIGRI